MSNADRDDKGPQGKAAAQDVYARVASAAASRSGSGASSAPGTSAGPGQKPGESSAQDKNTFPPRDGSFSPSSASDSAPSANGAVTPPAAGETAAQPAKSWKDRFDSVSRRVLGTDESSTATSSTATTGTSASSTPGKVDPPKEAPSGTVVRSATEPTAVVGAPVAAPAGRVTGARAPAPAPTLSPAAPAKTGDVETPDADKPKAGTPRRTRKARLRLSRLDPWSVMKTAFLFSIAGGIMLVVGIYAIWAVISGSGLFDNLNTIVAGVVSTPGDTTPFRVEDYVNTPKVMGVTAFLACIDVVIFTALATLGAFLYNLAATMLGGLEITLAED